MTAIAIARAAVSPLGGADALAPARAGLEAQVAIGRDVVLAEAGLARPAAARVAAADLDRSGLPGDADRAARLLATAARDLVLDLDVARPGWRSERLGLALGTSSGGMATMERAFAAHHAGEVIDADLARRATYFGPVGPGLAAAGIDVRAATCRAHVLAACAASTFAIGLATRWLERDAVDVVIAGGYDALALLVAAGFEAIRATTASRPAPFRAGRDGMSLGEGAGLVALVRADRVGASPRRFAVLGFGASSDAVHVTAPDRSGDGLARAAEAALADAARSGDDVVLVSAHATSTPFNDAMESRALARVAPRDPVVQPFKAQIGHTLGAAGVLETIAGAGALAGGIAPAAAGSGALDPDAPARLLALSASLDEARADLPADPLLLKLSAAFGGANAALVVARDGAMRPARAWRVVRLAAHARVDGEDDAVAALDAAGIALERRAKLDPLSLVACGAVARLAAAVGGLGGAGVVGGHALASTEIDARFFARILERGAAHAEPRAFPGTSPNVCAGHASILFGLTGPSAATCSGLDGGVEALALAAELVAAGDADRMVVVAADRTGEAARAILAAGFPHATPPGDGAVAALLVAEGPLEAPVVPLDLAPDHDGTRIGHHALVARLETLAARPAARGPA